MASTPSEVRNVCTMIGPSYREIRDITERHIASQLRPLHGNVRFWRSVQPGAETVRPCLHVTGQCAKQGGLTGCRSGLINELQARERKQNGGHDRDKTGLSWHHLAHAPRAG